eukprot:2876585-Rhodomonas_salina.1
MNFSVAFDIGAMTHTFNASEADYFRRKKNRAIKCLRWNQIEWDVTACAASNITEQAVRCDCTSDGAVTVVFKYLDDSWEQRFAVHAFLLRYTVNWAPLVYLISFGLVLAFLIWLLEHVFSSSIARISLLFRHDVEYYVARVRGYHKSANGWYGSNMGSRNERHQGWVRISSFLEANASPGETHSWRSKFMVVDEGSAQYYSKDTINVHTRNGCLRMEGTELLLFDEAERWMAQRGWDKTNRPAWSSTTFILLGDKAAAETMAEEDSPPRQFKKMKYISHGSFRHRVGDSFKEHLSVVPSQVEMPSILICEAESEQDLVSWVNAVVSCKARSRVGGIKKMYDPSEASADATHKLRMSGDEAKRKNAEQDEGEWGMQDKWMKLLAECKFMDQRRTSRNDRLGAISEDLFRLAVVNALEPDSAEESWEERSRLLVSAEAYVADAETNRDGDVNYLEFIRRRTGHHLVDSASAAKAADEENGIERPPTSPVTQDRDRTMANPLGVSVSFGDGVAEGSPSIMTKLPVGARVSGVESRFVGAGDGSLVLERRSPTPYISQTPHPPMMQQQDDNWPLMPEPQQVGGVQPTASSTQDPDPRLESSLSPNV